MSALTHESRPHRTLKDRRQLKQLVQLMNRALRDSQGGGLMERFEAVSKLLFTKIVDEREASGTWNGLKRRKKEEELRPRPGESDRVLYERARAIWQRAISAHPGIFNGSRAGFPKDVGGVARILQLMDGIALSETPDDIKGGAYEELLHDTFEKNENQQYFTPRHIVDFMIRLCDPSPGDAICDPACGSGGFLVGALSHVDEDGGALLASRMRGIEVDERMAWVARINMVMHGGDPKAIRHLRGPGSLAPLTRIAQDLPADSFDLILTNPPFGSDMTDVAALRELVTGEGRSSRRRGVLFVERCLDLLRPGGRLAIILDDSVLNLAKNEDVQSLLRQRAIVEAVVSLPDVTFMPYSTAKSSILVARLRETPDEIQTRVFMADVENVGNRPNGDPLYEYDENGKRRLKTDLPAVLDLYQRFRGSGKRVDAVFEGTTVFTANVDEFEKDSDGARLDVFFYHPMRKVAQRRLKRSTHPLVKLGDVMEMDGATVNPAEEFGEAIVRWIGLGDIEANTGRHEVREVIGDKVRSNAHTFRGGDVLYSRLRPKLRKAILLPNKDEGGVCSAELLVLRPRTEFRRKIDPSYVAYLLRSDLALGQLIYRITGVGRPRVSAEAVRELRLPLPPIQVQKRFVQHLQDAARKASRLRAEAMRRLEMAGEEMEKAYGRVLGQLFPSSSKRSSSSVKRGAASSSASSTSRTASA